MRTSNEHQTSDLHGPRTTYTCFLQARGSFSGVLVMRITFLMLSVQGVMAFVLGWDGSRYPHRFQYREEF
jgi:hypothetical protein